MTTYGTIPTTSNPPSRLSLSKNRPWSQMFSLRFVSLPSSFGECLHQLTTNASYFQSNYATIALLILFLSLLWHPISLIVFFLMMVPWLYLYFLREAPVTLLDRLIDENLVLVALTVLTLVFLFLTDAKVNIVVAVAIGVVLAVAHAVVRRTDDLMVDVFDEERVGAGIRVGYAVVPLMDFASSTDG